MSPLFLLRNSRGVSAIGTAIAVSVGVGAAGVALMTQLQSVREAGVRDAAKTIARQLNKDSMELTMGLMKSQAIVQRDDAGRRIWVSQAADTPSGDRQFIPDGGASSPARVIFTVCDPRFTNGESPNNLAACTPLDRVSTEVTLLPDSGNQHEVRVVTRVPLLRRNPATDLATEMTESAADRALLSESSLECSTPPVVLPASVLASGQTFTLRVSNVNPPDATASIVETGTYLAGAETKEAVLTAPTVNVGEPPIQVTYTVRLASGAGTVSCAPVTVTVSPCKPYTSDEPVREIYRQFLVDYDSGIPATGLDAHTRSIANGTAMLEDIDNSFYNTSEYNVRSGNNTYGAPAKELAINAIAMTRVFLNHGGTDADIRNRVNYLLNTARNYPQCLYTSSGSSRCSNASTLNFPRLAAAFRTLVEFSGPPNAGQTHKQLVDEAYRRYLGLEEADMTATDIANRDNYVNRLANGTIPYWTPASGGLVNELMADPRYVAGGGFNGESLNGMIRTLYGRHAMSAERAYYSNLVSRFGASQAYISRSLRNSTEWSTIGGCPVARPTPVCRITANKTSLRPGESVGLTLQAYDNLSSVGWDGAAQTVSGSGPQEYTKSGTAGSTAGVNFTSSATVVGPGGTSSCSISLPVKDSCDIVQHRRGTHYCRSNYTLSAGYVPAAGSWHHARYHVGGYYDYGPTRRGWSGWDNRDVYNWIPEHNRTSNAWPNGNASLQPHEWFYLQPNPRGVSSIILTMYAPTFPATQSPVLWRDNCDGAAPATVAVNGADYIMFSNPSNPAQALSRGEGGVCGSRDCRCFVKSQVSPLVVDLEAKGIEYQPHVPFDLSEGKQEYFWPKYKDSAHFVVLDRNGNGMIDDVQELFGDKTVGPNKETYKNGFEALKTYDSNNDDFIDSKDVVFSKLKLWGDRNMNGVSESQEMRSLSEAGVARIDLKYLNIQEENDNFGNKSNQRSIVELKNGEWRKVFDLWFVPSGSPMRQVASKE